MIGPSLWTLCLWLFIDGATLAASSTILLLHYGKYHEPWRIAVLGAAASVLGSCVQLLVLRWALSTKHRWLHRFAPSREKIEATLKTYPSASFLAIAVARATPLPDAPLKLVAAVVEYPIVLYGLASYLGQLPYFYVLALVGSKVHIPTWMLISALALVLVAIVVDRWRKRRARAA